MNLNKILENVGNEILPPFIFRALVNLRAQMIFAFYMHKKIVSVNKKWENSANGKRAFLLATGPSIQQDDLKGLQGEDCFSVSNFYLHEDIHVISPRLHFFAPYHPPLIQENYVNWLKHADAVLPPSTGIVLGHKTYEIVRKYEMFNKRDVFYMFLEPMFSGKTNMTRPVMGPQTGPLMILPWLIFMGYSEIYLLGCDHTVLRDYGKTVSNFYSPEKDMRENATDQNSWCDLTSLFINSARMFKQYAYYKKAADRKKARIVNLSPDSWLDVFERKRFSSVI
jgi:hypothetical protein